MTDNIIKIKEPPSVLHIERGGHTVVCEGRLIPNIHAYDRGDAIEFILDRRFSYTFPKELAYLALNFAANAMAIGAGYPWLGAQSKDRPFAPEVMDVEITDQPPE